MFFCHRIRQRHHHISLYRHFPRQISPWTEPSPGQRPHWTETPPDKGPPGQRHPPDKDPPQTETSLDRDGKERVVRILLECILVIIH